MTQLNTASTPNQMCPELNRNHLFRIASCGLRSPVDVSRGAGGYQGQSPIAI